MPKALGQAIIEPAVLIRLAEFPAPFPKIAALSGRALVTIAGYVLGYAEPGDSQLIV